MLSAHQQIAVRHAFPDAWIDGRVIRASARPPWSTLVNSSTCRRHPDPAGAPSTDTMRR